MLFSSVETSIRVIQVEISAGFKMPGSKCRNMSGESKKVVICGICGHRSRRDNMKSRHFPSKHQGKKYIEKGEQSSVKWLTTDQAIDKYPKDLQERMVESDDESMQSVHSNNEETTLEETAEKPPQNEHVVNENSKDEAIQLSENTVNALSNMLNEKLDPLTKKISELQIAVVNNDRTEQDSEIKDAPIVENQILRVNACKTIEDLCISAELTMYINQKQLVCDICDEDSKSDVRKSGEFSYDFETEGTDFSKVNQPRKFRNLKSHVVLHLKSQTHTKAKSDKEGKDKQEEKDETYNYKIGMKLAKIVYSNIKERESYAKYSRDIAHRASNGEDLGNINHSEDFAKELTEAMGVQARIELTKHFNSILPCTGELPPVMFASDKMTMKKKTGHIAVVITPDTNAPLSEDFLKPVFLGMPVTRHHDGRALSEQMLNILDQYLTNVEEQLQAVSNDGQYIHLNVKMHFMQLREGFKDKKEWLKFYHDPAHRINLASNDASKDNTDDTHAEGSLSEVTKLVQKVNKHVGYGKHNLELEMILKDMGINDKNKPLTFSDTRFPQFAYFVLRNFVNSYPALVEQIKYELSYTDDKSDELKETLKSVTDLEFVVKLLGATDIFRRQQILSQQSQKVDQLVSDVYGNIKMQRDKLEGMNKDLDSTKHPSDWTVDDIKNLDELNWAETRKGLAQIVANNSYKGVDLEAHDEMALTKGIVELRNHLTRNVFALDKRFKNDFDNDFVQEVKDTFDLNWMLELKGQLEDELITINEANDIAEEKGISSLKFLMLRQSESNPPSQEEIAKVVNQYKKFKEYTLDIVMDKYMDKTKHNIKEHALQRNVVCFTCYRQFEFNKVLNHVKVTHKNENTQFGDENNTLSAIKVIHGICKDEKVYQDKKEFLAIALKVLCKIPNESVVECIGSIAELHTKPQRNCIFKRYETELLVDWNGPNLVKAGPFIEKSLDRHFGSRKKWNFKTGSSKFFISKVVDRINHQPSKLSFME